MSRKDGGIEKDASLISNEISENSFSQKTNDKENLFQVTMIIFLCFRLILYFTFPLSG